MRFERISADTIIGEIRELPADSIDEVGQAVLARVDDLVARLRRGKAPPTAKLLATLLSEDPAYLDVFRLFFAKSQDAIAHLLGAALGTGGSYSKFRSLAKKEPDRVARALVDLRLDKLIAEHASKRWGLREVLTERYMMLRGRAIAGQKRGRGLEDEVEGLLKAVVGDAYVRGQSFTGMDGKKAKTDFAIPGVHEPKIVIECKGFQATGSKLTDVLGDVEKVLEAKGPHMYCFVVTDGQGWLNRASDLRTLVKYQNSHRIDMIYTRRRLPDLEKAVKHIMTHEA